MPSKSEDGAENTYNSGSDADDDERDETDVEEKVTNKKKKKKDAPGVKTKSEKSSKKRIDEENGQVTNDQPTDKTATDVEKDESKVTKKKLKKWQYYSIIAIVVLAIIGIVLGIYLKPGKKNETNQVNPKQTDRVTTKGPSRTKRPSRRKNSNNTTPETIPTIPTMTKNTTTITPGWPSMPIDPWKYYEYMPSGACPPLYKTIKDLKEYYDAKDSLIDFCQNDQVRYQLPTIDEAMVNNDNDSRIIAFLEKRKIKHLIIDDASYGCRIVVVGTYYRTYDEARRFCKAFAYELVMFDTQVEKCMVTRQTIEDLKDQNIWKDRAKYMFVSGEQAFIDKERNLQFRGSTEKLLTGPLQFCKTPNQLREEVFSKSTLLQTLRDKNLALNMDDQQQDFGCLLPVDRSERYPFMCKRCGKRKDCRYVCEPGYNYKGFDCR